MLLSVTVKFFLKPGVLLFHSSFQHACLFLYAAKLLTYKSAAKIDSGQESYKDSIISFIRSMFSTASS